MSAADLVKLLKRATPHHEDVRTPDRTDIIRKHHGHLTLEEVVNTLDALEFSAESFQWQMRELLASGEAEGETAVHGLYRAAEGIALYGCPAPPAAPAAGGGEEPAAEAADGWEEKMAAAKARGAELFKAKDFPAAAEAYGEAVRATPKGQGDIHTLYSNRSAALLQMGKAEEALAEARRCVEASPSWPKGRFREGSCLRQLGCHKEALVAFRKGLVLEAENKDWAKEIDKTERLLIEQPEARARQLMHLLLPDILRAWGRSAPAGGADGGVLMLQVNAELATLGTPKWRLIRDGNPPKAQIRYAFLQKKGYLTNLAANLQSPPAAGVAVADVAGNPLKLAEASGFLFPPGGNADTAVVHIDVTALSDKKMAAILCRIPCGASVVEYSAPHKDPPPPKCAVDGVLESQKNSGFPKQLPSFIGFQALGGDLNYPVVDLARDAPGQMPS